MDYFIASGIKQKNIQDTLNLENFLGLNEITPMQTSYTQSAEDREREEGSDSKSTTDKSDDNKTEIEPSVNKSDDNQE